MIALRNLPGAKTAAMYMGKAAAGATARVAAAKSDTAASLVSGIGKTADFVSSAAGSTLQVIERSVEQVAIRAGKVGAYGFGGFAALIAGASYALGHYPALPMLAFTGFCAASGYIGGYFGTKLIALLTVTDKVEIVKGAADAVKDVCKPGDAPASAADSKKEPPAA
ncbi:MAG: hypothetical protein ACAI38_10915 [Myxococcota bacterium]